MSGKVRITLGPSRGREPSGGFGVRRTPNGLLIGNIGPQKMSTKIPFGVDGSVSYDFKRKELIFTDHTGVVMTVVGTDYTYTDGVKHTMNVIDADGIERVTGGTR